MNQRGFTLIEALVVVVITLLIVLGLYQLLEENERVFRSQQEIAAMNSQVRSAMEVIVRTVRAAGNNKTAFRPAPRIYIAESNRLRVLSDLPRDSHDPSDLDGDGDVCNDNDGNNYAILDCDGSGIAGDGDNENENVDGRLNDPYEDALFFLDGNQLKLRQFSSEPGLETGDPPDRPAISIDPDPPEESDELLAENVVELTFQYFIDSSTEIPMSGSPAEVDPGDLNDIKIVRVKLVAQTAHPERPGGRHYTVELTSDAELRNP